MIRCSYIPIKYLPLFLIFILVTAACTNWSPRVNRYGLPERKYIYHQPEKIDDGWETASLNEADIDSGKINEMMLDILGGNDKNIHSILLIKNGKLVFEEYFYGYNRQKLHFLASVSKSITSVLIGIAIDLTLAADIEMKAYEFFPDYTDTKWIYQKYPKKAWNSPFVRLSVYWPKRGFQSFRAAVDSSLA